MSRTVEVLFRGETRDVVVDHYDVDYDTNAVDTEWHFDGLEPVEHEALEITDAEEEAILIAIDDAMRERGDD